MTDRLVEDPDGVAALAAQVATQLGIPVEHVEKDFWVTEVLRGVVEAASALRVPVIFKGGTSLSKAYSIIQRFSEDVDVLVLLPADDTKGSRDRILKSLVEGAQRSTLRDPVSVANATTTGVKRGARFLLPRSQFGRRRRERRSVPGAGIARRSTAD